MIDMSKKYKTQDGRQVRIYAVDGRGDFPVHGAILQDEGWKPDTWLISGEYTSESRGGRLDLVEVVEEDTKAVMTQLIEHMAQTLYELNPHREEGGHTMTWRSGPAPLPEAQKEIYREMVRAIRSAGLIYKDEPVSNIITMYANVYSVNNISLHSTRAQADVGAQLSRIACVEVEVKYYEGEGL